MPEQRIKTEVIRVRVTTAEKEAFTSLCNSKAINQSELLRRLIQEWIKTQKEEEYQKRKTDLKNF